MYYHVSQTSGIQILKPRISTHHKAYVYAVDHFVTGLLFGAPQDDFDFIISNHDVVHHGNIPVVYECYPNAFYSIFYGKSCSVYEVHEDGFQRGMTSWDAELVCEQEVPVVREIFVNDLYSRLSDEAAAGHLELHRYEDSIEYKKRISEHIVDRLIRFDALDLTDERFQRHYSRIIAELHHIMDGHLL